MRLENEFEVNAPIEEVWQVLEDVPRVARCMPGAELTSSDGNQHEGTVKARLGPMRVTYQGQATVTELDASAHRAAMTAEGRETRGQGRAKADVSLSAEEHDGRTKVTIATELDITGRVAQFGRGLLEDVSTQLIDEFAAQLEREVVGAEPAPAPAGAGEPAAAEASGAPSAERATQPASTGAAEAIDVGSLLSTVAARPAVAFSGGVVLGLLIGWLLGRR